MLSAHLRFELHQERGEGFSESFDARLLLGIYQRPVRLDRLACLGHGDLVWQDDDADAHWFTPNRTASLPPLARQRR